MKKLTIQITKPNSQLVEVVVPDDHTWDEAKAAAWAAMIPYTWKEPMADLYKFALLKEEEASEEVEPKYSFSMYTDEGDEALGQAVDHLIQMFELGKYSRNDLPEQIGKMLDLVTAMGHGECRDTEPEWAVVDELNSRLCDPQGWVRIDRDDF